ncbi:MAG: dihydrodipicolinate synthase family protein [Dialister invisus]
MAIAKFGRVITAMITPFKENGDVNYEGASSLSKYLVNHGSEGILVGGTTGEGATMSSEEKLKLYKMIVDAVGKNGTEKRVSVIGNVGTIGTKETIEFLKEAEKTGIDAALVIVPFYVKPTQEGMYQHFKAIAESTELPIILYNVPDVSVLVSTRNNQTIDRCLPQYSRREGCCRELGSGNKGKDSASR